MNRALLWYCAVFSFGRVLNQLVMKESPAGPV